MLTWSLGTLFVAKCTHNPGVFNVIQTQQARQPKVAGHTGIGQSSVRVFLVSDARSVDRNYE